MTTTDIDRPTTIPTPQPSTTEGDLYIDCDQADPYIDKCPAWCTVNGFHTVVGNEVDRRHHGTALFVPIRSLPTRFLKPAADNDVAAIAFRDMCISLERPAEHRNPRIRVEVPDAQTARVVHLSIEEAQHVADCLIAFVKESQR